MRITNTMISDNAALNINGNKISVDANNTKMTTQKKINRPSEDPVIAVRSLKLQTSLAKINQYYEKNIPDAESWLDVTETALLNIRDIMTDVRTLAVRGATDTLTESDRKTIYTQLKKLQEQCFAEGNADYAGRTVFTGFRTDKNLAFMSDDKNTTYDIEEQMEAVNMTKSRFYTNEVEMPTNPTMVKDLKIKDTYSKVTATAGNPADSGWYEKDTTTGEYTLSTDTAVDATKTYYTMDDTGSVIPDTMEIQESDYYKLRLSYNLNQGGTTTDSVTAMNFYTKNKDDSLTLRTTLDLTVTPELDANGEYQINNGYVTVKEATYATMASLSSGNYYTVIDATAQTGYTDTTIRTVLQFENETDWAEWSKQQTVADSAMQTKYYESSGAKFDEDGHPLNKFVPDGAVVIIKETGDAIYGEDVATALMTEKQNISFDYTKTGFNKGELRPEYYFDSVLRVDENGNQMGAKKTDALGKVMEDDAGNAIYEGIRYDRYEKTRDADGNYVLTKQALYSIDYTISQNQTLGVNLEAEECFNHDIYQDMDDMIDAVSKAMAAHDKVEKIKEMQKEDQYQADPYPEKLSAWLEIAQKEMDYYDNNLSKLYSETLGKLDTYLGKVNLAITDLGCRSDQLKLTEKRMSDQQETVEELKSNNDNIDLSQIIMDYTSSYTAYQSSLVAAGKLGEQTLLNYI